MFRSSLSKTATNVLIVGAVRTPVGSYLGALSSIPATDLGAIAISGAIQNVVKKETVQECLMGNVLSANLGQAPARQAALKAGLSESTVCTTINKVCASGMKAVCLGAQSVMLGFNEIVVAGGMENMSQAPFYLDARRGGLRLGDQKLTDAILKDGLWDPKYLMHMGSCAEETAVKLGISREDQDAYAFESYERAAKATASGQFKKEIVLVTTEKISFTEDEEYKKFNREKMIKLKPAFKPDGTITAGNSSTLSDGASAVLMVSDRISTERNLRPLARILSFADAECNPKDFPVAPSLAIPIALKRADLRIEDVDLFEINEAFSVVSLANQQVKQLLKIDPKKLNIHGGGVSLGHPIGSSGARIIVTLTHALRSGQIGCAAICNGGGGATAIIIEKL